VDTADGTGNPWFRRDIGIRGGNITRPGHITVNSGETEVQSTPEGEIAQKLEMSLFLFLVTVFGFGLILEPKQVRK